MTTIAATPRKSASKKPIAPRARASRAQRLSLDMVTGQTIVTYQHGDPDALRKSFTRIVRAMKRRKSRSGAPTVSQLLVESRNRFGRAA